MDWRPTDFTVRRLDICVDSVHVPGTCPLGRTRRAGGKAFCGSKRGGGVSLCVLVKGKQNTVEDFPWGVYRSSFKANELGCFATGLAEGLTSSKEVRTHSWTPDTDGRTGQ